MALGYGGAIFNNNSVVTVTNSTFSGNTVGGYGGGIFNDSGKLTMTNSTFSGNTAGGFGGGIYTGGSTLTMTNSTFSGNTSLSLGGAVYVESGTETVSNSIFTGNTASSSGAGISDSTGTVSADSNVFYNNLANGSEDDCNGCTSNTNAVTGDPMLSALGNYGGPTQTMIPLPGSAAICAGALANILSGLTTDQRSYSNKNSTYPGYTSDAPCVDAGAVQTNYSLSLAAPAVVSPAVAIMANAAFTDAVTLNESGSAFTGAAVTIPALTFSGAGTLKRHAAATTLTANGTATYTGLQVSAAGSGDALTATLPLNSSLSNVPSLTAGNSFAVESPLSLSPASSALTGGKVAVAYRLTFTTTGGSGSYSYALTGGSLPTGLTLTGGVLQGTPIEGGSFNFTVTVTDTANTLLTASQPYSLTITAPGIALASAPLAAAVYSTAYNSSGAISIPAATGGVGPYTYALVAGSSLPAGLNLSDSGAITGTPTAAAATYPFAVVATDTGSANSSGTNYSASQGYSLTIGQATATVTLGALTQTYNGDALAATATTTPAGLMVNLTYNGSPTAPATAGNYTVVATINDSNYTGTATGTLVVAQASSKAGVSSNANPVLLQNAVTWTATVTSTAGTPTGTVNFLDGTTPLGTGTLAGGVATLTTSALAVGSHTIMAAYSGDTNFQAVASGTLTESVLDFSLSSSGSASQTVASGGTATYTLAIAPSSGSTFPSAVTLTLNGLPTGATVTVTPSSWTQSTGTTWTLPANTAMTGNTQLVILLPQTTTAAAPAGGSSGTMATRLAPFTLALLLLPFATRLRRAGKRLGQTSSYCSCWPRPWPRYPE